MEPQRSNPSSCDDSRYAHSSFVILSVHEIRIKRLKRHGCRFRPDLHFIAHSIVQYTKTGYCVAYGMTPSKSASNRPVVDMQPMCMLVWLISIEKLIGSSLKLYHQCFVAPGSPQQATQSPDTKYNPDFHWYWYSFLF